MNGRSSRPHERTPRAAAGARICEHRLGEVEADDVGASIVAPRNS